MTDLTALAVESYAHDVQTVAGELAVAADPATFAAALRELVELASSGRVLVADDGEDLLVTAEASTFRVTVEQTRIADPPGICTALGRSTPCS